MVSGFTRSEDGVREYKKIGLSYPNEMDDNLYEDWLTKTTAEDLNRYTSHKEKELRSIRIVKADSNDANGVDLDDEDDSKKKNNNNNTSKEDNDKTIREPNAFILYDFNHYRLDPACNVVSRYRSI